MPVVSTGVLRCYPILALFLLALEPGAFLLCQGWDDRFGLQLGEPLGPATQHLGTGVWSRAFEHGTNATWANVSDGASGWRVRTAWKGVLAQRAAPSRP